MVGGSVHEGRDRRYQYTHVLRCNNFKQCRVYFFSGCMTEHGTASAHTYGMALFAHVCRELECYSSNRLVVPGYISHRGTAPIIGGYRALQKVSPNTVPEGRENQRIPRTQPQPEQFHLSAVCLVP